MNDKSSVVCEAKGGVPYDADIVWNEDRAKSH